MAIAVPICGLQGMTRLIATAVVCNEPVKFCHLTTIGHRTYSVQKASTDAIGTFTLTLTNVVVGSRVHIEKASDGTAYYDGVAGASTVVLSLSAYVSGSVNNDLKIKVRNASGTPTYKPFETQAVAIVGAGSVYVSQILDE